MGAIGPVYGELICLSEAVLGSPVAPPSGSHASRPGWDPFLFVVPSANLTPFLPRLTGLLSRLGFREQSSLSLLILCSQ